MWIKPGGEMSFLYGNNVLKAHLGRITENTPKYHGVVFYSMSDVPLGKPLFHSSFFKHILSNILMIIKLMISQNYDFIFYILSRSFRSTPMFLLK